MENNIKKIIGTLQYAYGIDEAQICKKNEGFIVSFHEYEYDDDEFVEYVSDIKDIIYDMKGFLLIGGCNNTLHIVIFNKIMYLEDSETMYLELNTGKIIKYKTYKERAQNIANKIGLKMHIL